MAVPRTPEPRTPEPERPAHRLDTDDLDAEHVVEDAIGFFADDDAAEQAAQSPASDTDTPPPG